MQFSAFIAGLLVAAFPATHAFKGYEGLYCEGKPNVEASCHGGCHSFANSSSFRALYAIIPAPVCFKMWTEPDCTGTPYVYTNQASQCTAITFPAASFSCGYTECA